MGGCGACEDGEEGCALVPVSRRNGKYSPLRLGVISVLCDPLLIPSLIALSRGVSELREVRRREAEGHRSPDHRDVRTGAIWGILLGGARPAAALLLAAIVVFDARSPAPAPPPPAPPHDEIADLMMCVTRCAEDAQRRAAIDQLDALGPRLDPDQRRRLLRHGLEGELPSGQREALLANLVATDEARALTPEELRPLQAMGPPVRAALYHYIAWLSPDPPPPADHWTAVGLMWRAMLRREDRPELIPAASLARTPLRAEALSDLLSLPDTHPAAGLALILASERCDDEPLDERLGPRLLARLRAEPSEADVRLAGCVPGPGIHEALIQLAREGGTRGAVALLAALRRGGEVPRDVVAALTAEPATYRRLSRDLRPLGRTDLIPPRHRTVAHRIEMTARARYPFVTRVERRRVERDHTCVIFADGDGRDHVAYCGADSQRHLDVATPRLDEDHAELCARVCGQDPPLPLPPSFDGL